MSGCDSYRRDGYKRGDEDPTGAGDGPRERRARIPQQACREGCDCVLPLACWIACRHRRRAPSAPPFALKGGGEPDLYRVPLAVLTLLAEAAEDQPLLCLIDDAQWVDGDSAQALTFAAHRLQAERIAIVLAAREGEFDAAAPPSKRFSRPAPARLLLPMSRVASASGGNALAFVELAPLRRRLRSMSSDGLGWRTLSSVSLPPAIPCPC